MEEKVIKLSVADISDLSQGLVILIKELDRHTVGSDRLLSDRIDIILKKIEKQAKVK